MIVLNGAKGAPTIIKIPDVIAFNAKFPKIEKSI